MRKRGGSIQLLNPLRPQLNRITTAQGSRQQKDGHQTTILKQHALHRVITVRRLILKLAQVGESAQSRVTVQLFLPLLDLIQFPRLQWKPKLVLSECLSKPGKGALSQSFDVSGDDEFQAIAVSRCPVNDVAVTGQLMTNPFACPADLAEPEHRWRPGAHCYALDGIRGLAALMVLCCHCLVFPDSLNLFTSTIQRFTSVGWTGVNLFFVLSGYLISGILLDTRNFHRRWKSFIARRTLRIFPVYFATLLVIFHVIPWVSRGNFGSPANPEDFATGELWYWTCLQNWAFVWRGSWTSEPGLNHLWSIAVEEQFYLIWPFLVWQFDRRTLKSACFGLIIIALLLRIGFIEVGFAPISTYALPICRIDAFCVGTLIALWHREPQWLDRWVRVLPRIACCSLLTLVFIDVWFNILRPGTYLSATLSHTVCSLVFGTIIAATATAPRNHWISVFFENSMLRLLGKYSYSLYIFHGFVQPHVFAWDWGWMPEQLRSWAIFSTIFSITLFGSLLSWRLVEQPFLKLKRFFPRSVDGQSTEFTPASKSEDIQRNEMGLIEVVNSTDAQPPTNRLPRSPRPLHSSAN